MLDDGCAVHPGRDVVIGIEAIGGLAHVGLLHRNADGACLFTKARNPPSWRSANVRRVVHREGWSRRARTQPDPVEF